jgi:hypothetical protein
MSHDTNIPKQEITRHPSISPFPARYALPDDQIAQAIEFVDSMAKYFPSSSDGLEWNLSRLRPKPTEKARVAMKHSFSVEGEEFTQDGDLPIDSVAMVGGLYALTGAETVYGYRIPRSGGITTNTVRKGTYNNQDVYFSESIHTSLVRGSEPSKSSMTVWILGTEQAKRLLERPDRRGSILGDIVKKPEIDD